MKLFIPVVVLMVVFGISAFYLGKESNRETNEPPISSPEIVSSPSPSPSPFPTPSPTPKKELTQSQKELLSTIEARLPAIDREIANKKILKGELQKGIDEATQNGVNPSTMASNIKVMKELDLDIKVLEAEKQMLTVQKVTLLSSIEQ